MTNTIVAILAICVGALFCFWGIAAMRVVIAVWGAFAGFNLGAGLVSAIGNEGFLTSALGWIVGILIAVLFALLAYLYYAVAITLMMATIGFVLGTAAMAAFGVTWNWLVIAIGVIIGVLLAWAAIAVNLPAILLVVFSALGGSTAIVGGVMMLSDQLHTSEFTSPSVTAHISHSWWWYALYLGLALVGIIVQARMLRTNADLREQWTGV